MRDDFSLARPAGHLIMGDGSGPDDLAKRDGAKALSGAESGDTATTPLDKPSRTKNLITECKVIARILLVNPKRRKLCLARAFVEGLKILRSQRSISSRVTWK